MDLSLKNIVRTRYSITGSFSVINDVLSRAKHDVSEGVYRTAEGSVSLRHLLLALIPSPPPPPPPQPAKIVYFRAAPNDGYINVGQSATLSWQITNYQTDTNVSLKGKEGVGPPVLNIPRLPIQGSQTVTPAYDTQYTLTVSDSRGQISQTKLVKLYAASPPIGSVFYFKMTNPQSQVTACFTVAIYANDQMAAKRMAEQQNGGYKAESINASQFATACG